MSTPMSYFIYMPFYKTSECQHLTKQDNTHKSTIFKVCSKRGFWTFHFTATEDWKTKCMHFKNPITIELQQKPSYIQLNLTC